MTTSSESKSLGTIFKEVVHSPIGYLYTQCIGKLDESEFYDKIDYEIFPTKDEVFYRGVWNLWFEFAMTETEIPDNRIEAELLEGFDHEKRKQFLELTQIHPQKYMEFLTIIRKFICLARLRLLAQNQCGFWDKLRLGCHVLKRAFLQMICIRGFVGIEERLEEDQEVYCREAVKKLKSNDYDKKICNIL